MRLRFLVTPLTAAILAVQSASGQTGQQQPIGYKDPTTATILSVVVTGGGQFYSGDTHKGAMLLGIGWGSLIVGEGVGLGLCGSGSCTVGAPVVLAGLVVGLGSWIYGIMDASNAADRHNATLARPRTASLDPVVLPDNQQGKSRVGLSLKLRF